MTAHGQAQADEATEKSLVEREYETPEDLVIFNDDFEEERDRPVGRERAGIYLTALVALTVPSIIVSAFFFPAADNEPTEAIAPSVETTGGLDRVVVNKEVTLDVAEDEGEAAPVVDVDPAAIEVTMYNQDLLVDGTAQFALRLSGVATTSEIDTDLFAIEVHNSTGELAATRFEFLHETLPVDSSAIAAVEAAGLDGSAHFVVVAIGDLEVVKLPLDVGAFS